MNSETTGVLLINLGTPRAPDEDAVREYLDEFLMDRHVLTVPWLIRRLIVSLAILPRRPAQSAEAYAKIWRPDGSPLLVESQALTDALSGRLNNPVALAMRYGMPSVTDALDVLRDRGVTQLLVVPLYPQHALSTSVSAEVAVGDAWSGPVTTMPAFFDNPRYIEALATVTRPSLQSAEPDHVLFSFHGVPLHHLDRTDPGRHCLQSETCCETPDPAHLTCYRHQARVTSARLAEALALEGSAWSICYQSRILSDRWLRPFTDEVLVELAQAGKKRLLVVCPAFVADNLETLEEIGIRGREAFIEAGGESLELAPCLNAEPVWVDALAAIIGEHLQ